MKMNAIGRTLIVTLGAALAVSAGCSSGGSDDAQKFIGQWTFSSGSLTAACPAPINTQTLDLTNGTFTIAKGTTSALTLTFNMCMLTFKVAGSQASADPVNQPCAFNVPPFGSVSATISSWTLDAVDSSTLSATVTGSALTGCPVNATGTAMRGAPDASADGG